MAIDNLIARLSDENPRPARFGPAATVALAACLALAVVLVESIAWLKLRPDFAAELALYNSALALKLLFTGSIVVTALPIVHDLSIPGRRLRRGALVAALPFAAIMAFALWELTRLPVSEWTHH